MTIGKRGIYGNVGLPGSGLSYRTRLDAPAPRGRNRTEARTEASAPEEFRYRFVGERIEYIDENDRPLDPSIVAAIKRAYREQLKRILESRVAALNVEFEGLPNLHIQTPPPLPPAPAPRRAAPPFELPKPLLTGDSDDREEFAARLSDWQVARAQHERENGRVRPDLAAIAEPVLVRLGAISWPRETNISVDLDETGSTLVLAIDLPELADMPSYRYALALRDLAIVTRPLTASAITRLYADHAHSVVFRVAGEVFAAEGSVETVIIGAYRQEYSKATGSEQDVWLMSVAIRRSEWRELDFSNLAEIDPKVSVARFELMRNMTAGGAFKPIAVGADLLRVAGHA